MSLKQLDNYPGANQSTLKNIGKIITGITDDTTITKQSITKQCVNWYLLFANKDTHNNSKPGSTFWARRWFTIWSDHFDGSGQDCSISSVLQWRYYSLTLSHRFESPTASRFKFKFFSGSAIWQSAPLPSYQSNFSVWYENSLVTKRFFFLNLLDIWFDNFADYDGPKSNLLHLLFYLHILVHVFGWKSYWIFSPALSKYFLDLHHIYQQISRIWHSSFLTVKI